MELVAPEMWSRLLSVTLLSLATQQSRTIDAPMAARRQPHPLQESSAVKNIYQPAERHWRGGDRVVLTPGVSFIGISPRLPSQEQSTSPCYGPAFKVFVLDKASRKLQRTCFRVANTVGVPNLTVPSPICGPGGGHAFDNSPSPFCDQCIVLCEGFQGGRHGPDLFALPATDCRYFPGVDQLALRDPGAEFTNVPPTAALEVEKLHGEAYEKFFEALKIFGRGLGSVRTVDLVDPGHAARLRCRHPRGDGFLDPFLFPECGSDLTDPVRRRLHGSAVQDQAVRGSCWALGTILYFWEDAICHDTRVSETGVTRGRDSRKGLAYVGPIRVCVDASLGSLSFDSSGAYQSCNVGLDPSVLAFGRGLVSDFPYCPSDICWTDHEASSVVLEFADDLLDFHQLFLMYCAAVLLQWCPFPVYSL